MDAALARRFHLEFVRSCWQRPTPFIIGRHTRAICAEIDEGMRRYAAGLSTFLIVEVPFRHGKSEVLSRMTPPHWLGRFPDTEVMLTTYGQDLATDLSREARRVMLSSQYSRVYSARVSEESSAADRWGVHGHLGAMNAQGFGGAMTGRGCALGIVDDYLKRRRDAESKSVRDAVWESFANDFMTRRGPVAFIIILASRWHVDDLIGRCHAKMAEDPDFPRFRTVTFPALDDRYGGDGTLFPEMFPKDWYLSQRATLGQYGFASLMQCSPTVRGGNLLRTEPTDEFPHAGVKYYNAGEPGGPPASLRWVRAWDLASSARQGRRASDEPDYTCGLLFAVQDLGGERKRLWVDDAVRGQWAAPERDARMDATASRDGPRVRIGVEVVAGYKDTFSRMQARLRGRFVVEKVTVSSDLAARTEDVQPIFEAGEVYVRRAPWTAAVVEEWGDFPSGANDDTVAALMAGWDMTAKHGPAAPPPAEDKQRPVTAGMRDRRF